MGFYITVPFYTLLLKIKVIFLDFLAVETFEICLLFVRLRSFFEFCHVPSSTAGILPPFPLYILSSLALYLFKGGGLLLLSRALLAP